MSLAIYTYVVCLGYGGVSYFTFLFFCFLVCYMHMHFHVYYKIIVVQCDLY